MPKIKRIFDLAISFFVLLLLLPLLILVTLMIRIKLGVQIFFKQSRLGLNGNIFDIYKFRTMTYECDKDRILLSHKIRLTKFRKFLIITSLDELPQLFNILENEMSLAGPRPLLVEYL